MSKKMERLDKLIANMIPAIYSIEADFQEEAPIGIVDFNKWEWTQGVGLYTLWKYYKQSNDKNILRQIEIWYKDRFAEGLPEKNVNTMCPMLTLCFLYEETKNVEYLPYLHEWAAFALYEMVRTKEGGIQHKCTGCENKEQLWDDTLYMTVMFMAKYGQLFNKPEFIEESEYQFLIHIKYLTDRATGLWFHGWSFERKDHFAKALWNRGNSWITAGIPDYLELVQPVGSVKRFIIESYVAQVEALIRTQNESGLWHTLLDDTTSYLESSGSANFAYGIMKGIRMGLLPKTYFQNAEKCIDALCTCVDEKGCVGLCSYGTGMGLDLDHYKNIPICPMPYGQTLCLIAFMEYKQYVKEKSYGQNN